MTRGAKKALAVAVGGLSISGLIQAPAQAEGQTVWQSSGPANGGANQDFLNPANWTLGVPTTTEYGLFSTAAIPPKSVINNTTAQTVNINTAAGVGAIIDTFPSATGNQFDITGPTSGTALLSLYGVPYTSIQSTGTYTESNVVLDMESPFTNHLDVMDLGSTLNLSLVNAQNTIIAGAGTASGSGQLIQIDGNISDGPGVSSALTILGGGTGSVTGGTVYLTGTNAFSGGITVGTGQASDIPQANAQGGALEIGQDKMASGGNINGSLSVVANNTGTGNVVINEQGQLLLNTATTATGSKLGAGTYYFMNTNQTLTLEGIGENKTNSGALRTAPAKNVSQTDVILANVVIGSSEPIDGYDGDVIISATKIPGVDVQFYGVVSGSGGIDKQGAGTIEFSNPNNSLSGPTQLGNGVVQVDNGSSMGTGDLIMAQTSNNVTLVNLFNATQNVGNLSSTFSQGSLQNLGTLAAYQQSINLYGTANGTNLILNQTQNTSYGYTSQAGFNTLTSTINGAGTLTLAASSTGTLTLNGSNTYSGGTYINGGTLVVANGNGIIDFPQANAPVNSGSATGSGDVFVAAKGSLSSGNLSEVLGTQANSGTISGNVNLSGTLNPGGIGFSGQLFIGQNLTANTGSTLNFDVLGATNAASDTDQITVAGSLLGDGSSGQVNLNVNGPGLALGNYNLITAQSPSTTLPNIVLNSTPSSNPLVQRNYQVVTSSGGVTLEITEAGTDRFWSPGGVNPQADGSGTWTSGGGNFLTETAVAGVTGFSSTPYSNTDLQDVIIGNGGSGGTITLGSPVVVQGPLGFNPVSSPYTISGGNTLQVNAGIVSANTTTISVPVILGAAGKANTFTASVGTTLTFNAGINEGAITGQSLTTSDSGTIILNGTSTYTGGTTVSQGTLQVTTAGLPSAGGVNVSSAGSLVFDQNSPGSYSGLISGAGAITINNAPAVATSFTNAGNSYTGGTVITGGILSVSNIGALGTDDGGITLNGGTLQAAGDLSFPLATANNPASSFTLNSGTSSTIDTQGFNITMGPILAGAGNLTKIGSGTLTLSNIHSTNVIGTLSVTGGALVFNESGDPSFGFSGPSTSNGFVGDIDINQPTDLRLYTGNISGGGNINIAAAANGTIIEGRQITVNGNPFGLTTIGNAINILGGGSTIEFLTGDSGDVLTLAGPITGNVADIDFTGGTATSSIVLAAQSSYTGQTTIDEGAGVEVQLAISNALPATTDLHVTDSGTFDLLGFSQTVASLTANGASESGIITNESKTASSVLTINGTSSTTYDGLFEDQYSLSQGVTATLGLTLNQSDGGSLTLANNNVLPAGQGSVGLTGPINIISGRLELQALTAMGAPQTVTVGQTPNNSQLRFNGVSGTMTYSDLGNPSVPASQVSYILNGLGGFTTAGGTVDPGAISVENSSAVVLPNAVSLTAVSGIQIDGTSSLQITGPVTGAGGLVVTGGGPLILSGINSFTGGISVSGGSPLNLAANTTLANTAGTGAISGNAALTIGAPASSADVVLAKNSGVSSVSSLAISGATSQLDLTNNALVITSASASATAAAAASVRAELISGYNSDKWTGSGITSSSAAVNPGLFAVGYTDGNTDLGTPAGANQIYIKETIAGDANLDGLVNFSDLLLVAQDYGRTGQDWGHGDFNYDALVNFSDLLLVAQNYGKQLSTSQLAELPGSFSAQWQLAEAEVSAAQTTSVPEPATMSLLAMSAAGLLARRRRRAQGL